MRSAKLHLETNPCRNSGFRAEKASLSNAPSSSPKAFRPTPAPRRGGGERFVTGQDGPSRGPGRRVGPLRQPGGLCRKLRGQLVVVVYLGLGFKITQPRPRVSGALSTRTACGGFCVA